MQLSKAITNLLYDHDCVTIPGFGSFIINESSAKYIDKENKFYPPGKYVSFNPLIKTNDGLLANYPIDKVRETFELNFFSNLYLVQSLLPIMINQKWGRIIHFSSIIGNEGAKGAGIYASSKSALIGYSKTLSKEYGRFNINSNILELGYFDGGLANSLDTELRREILKRIPSKKLGNVQEISSCISLLIESSYVNGSILKINGGI